MAPFQLGQKTRSERCWTSFDHPDNTYDDVDVESCYSADDYLQQDLRELLPSSQDEGASMASAPVTGTTLLWQPHLVDPDEETPNTNP